MVEAGEIGFKLVEVKNNWNLSLVLVEIDWCELKLVEVSESKFTNKKNMT